MHSLEPLALRHGHISHANISHQHKAIVKADDCTDGND